MKTLVEGCWVLVGIAAFVSCVYTLKHIGAPPEAGGYLTLGLFALASATWFTHWKR